MPETEGRERWVKAMKEATVASVGPGDNDDMSSMVDALRKGKVVCTVRTRDVSRDQALHSAAVLASGFAADELWVVLDSHMSNSMTNPATGERWGPGEMQAGCEGAEMCATGIITDCMVLLYGNREGQRQLTVLPYHVHHAREIEASVEMLPDRLRSKISVQSNGCWLWTAATDKYGYGVVQAEPGNKKLAKAHRLVYELITLGPCPDGLEPDHRCETPACVNPHDLDWVTHADNARRGKKAKLTYDDAVEIRHLAESKMPFADIAAKFDTSPAYVGHIVAYRRWLDPVTPAPAVRLPLTQRASIRWVDEAKATVHRLGEETEGLEGIVVEGMDHAFETRLARDMIRESGAGDPGVVLNADKIARASAVEALARQGHTVLLSVDDAEAADVETFMSRASLVRKE